MSVIHLTERRLFKISGKDCYRFLQGLITQDVCKLEKAPAIFSAFLTPQGRFLADFFLVAQVLECSNASPESTDKDIKPEQIPIIYLDIHQKFAADFIKKLKIYKLRSQVEIAEIDNAQIYLSKEPVEGAAVSYLDPRHSGLGYRNIFIENKYQGEASLLEEYHKLRIALEVPDGAYDLTIDRSFILEFGYHGFNGVDFDKGCYVGQEVITRTFRRGVIRKEFKKFALTSEYADLQPGDEIIKDGKKIGVLCFRQGEEGVALLKKKD